MSKTVRPPHTTLIHIYCSRSFSWQHTEHLCLINKLICRLFCSRLFSFNKVLLCYCYSRRENMKKHPKLLRHSTLLTNHTSYCCVRAIIALRVHAPKCVFVWEVCAFVPRRVLWQAGRCKRSGASKQLAEPQIQQMAFHSESVLPFGPHFLSLLVKEVTAPASQHLCVCVSDSSAL